MTHRILITGGLGYLGGRVSRSLADSYFLRLTTRRPAPAKPDWLTNGELVSVDFLASPLEPVCRGMETIIHLAALNEIASAQDSEQALLVNELGTLRLLRAAQKERVKRFIYVSTAHVYGAPLKGTITEETLPRPAHPYAISHKAAEDWVLEAHDRKSLEGVVLRLSNSLGAPLAPEVDRWSLISNDLCRQAVTHRKLVLKSSGLQRRDFIALSDVCRAILHMMNLPAERVGDGLFNLGGHQSLQILELAQKISERCQAVLGYRPPVEHPLPNPGEVSHPLDYRIDRLTNTGFRLSGNLDSEIDATLKLCSESF